MIAVITLPLTCTDWTLEPFMEVGWAKPTSVLLEGHEFRLSRYSVTDIFAPAIRLSASVTLAREA